MGMGCVEAGEAGVERVAVVSREGRAGGVV